MRVTDITRLRSGMAKTLQGKRRALLVGVEQYGQGLEPLPVVNHDLDIMRHALEHCSYEIESDSGVLGPDNLTDLTNRFHEFCENCGEHDIHVIYFSGHGISVNGQDFVVPPGVSRMEAENSDYNRVSTNLNVGKGLVVFIVDACRDTAVTGTKLLAGPSSSAFLDAAKANGARLFTIRRPTAR
jgi:hypothetical protein